MTASYSKYAKLVLAGSFTLPDGRRCVNSDLVNCVALLWAEEQRDFDVVALGSATTQGVPPI
jgi:hypothetical protein